MNNIVSIDFNSYNNFTKLLLSSFIAHGFFDFLIFKSNITKHLFYYILNTFTITILFIVLPEIMLFFFILLSMYHFGNDFNIIFRKEKHKKKKLNVYGILIFSLSCITDNTLWIFILDKLFIHNIYLLLNILRLFGFISIFIFKKELFYYKPLILSLIISLIGVKGIFFYSCLIHSNLAMYQHLKSKNKTNIFLLLTLWISKSGLILILLNI